MANLRGLALRTLLPAFHGPRPPAWALRLAEEGLGGFTLFGFNIVDAEQVATLTAALRGARPDLVIATDEEGGDVTRLWYAQASPYPGNAALGVIDDVDLTRRVYRAIGGELASVGITLDMAPAVDVNSSDDNPAIGTRSFGVNSDRVAAHTAAAVTGLQSAGVAACAKHFPGHGATEEDSHHDLPTVAAPLELLEKREPPFVAAIEAGVRAVMTAHINVPALTGDRPATFSPRALNELLRNEMCFTGAIISDALEMRGASGAIGIPEAAVRALVAGNDLLCLGGEYPRLPGAEELVEATVDAIVTAVHTGRLGLDRLAEAAERATGLARLGGPPGQPNAAATAELGVAAARRAIRVEGILPANLGGSVIVQLEPPLSIAVGDVPWGLAPHLPGIQTVRMAELGPDRNVPAAGHVGVADAIAARAVGRSIVVVSRDTHRHGWARDIVESLVARHPGIVLVEMGWPAAWRPDGLAAYVATYGASRANAGALAEILGN